MPKYLAAKTGEHHIVVPGNPTHGRRQDAVKAIGSVDERAQRAHDRRPHHDTGDHSEDRRAEKGWDIVWGLELWVCEKISAQKSTTLIGHGPQALTIKPVAKAHI